MSNPDDLALRTSSNVLDYETKDLSLNPAGTWSFFSCQGHIKIILREVKNCEDVNGWFLEAVDTLR